jgi:subtilisin family serine protease
MKKGAILLILCSLVLVALFGQSYQPPFQLTPSNQRATIDLEQVPDSAFEPGIIRIKLNREYADHLAGLEHQQGNMRDFGIPQLDALSRDLEVSGIRRLFYSEAFDGQYLQRHKEWGFDLWYELEFPAGKDLRQAIRDFFALTKVINWAEPEYRKQLHWNPNDSFFGQQAHYNVISLPQAWDLEKGHPDVLVAIIDGGIQLDHPDLAASIHTNPGFNFVDDSSTIIQHYHGTHVAGTVAAKTNNGIGVAGIAGGSGAVGGVKMMSLQVFTDESSGGGHLAPIYAADNDAAISQNSWGYMEPNVYNQVDLDAIDYFNVNGGGSVMDGGISIFSAGNENSSANWYPGYYSGAFSVAATNNWDQKAYYSNYGSWVDVTAPGGELFQGDSSGGVLSTYTDGQYAWMQGTSMACPHVSGLAALIISKAHREGTPVTPAELADIIRDSADDISYANPYTHQLLGSGRINAHSALADDEPPQDPIWITSPLDGSIHDLGSSIHVTVGISSMIIGTVNRVNFLVNGEIRSLDWSAPFEWTWDTMTSGPGLQEIKAIAYTNLGMFEDTVYITLLAELDAPALTIERNSENTLLSWDAVSGAGLYEVYRSAAPDGEFEWIGSSSSTSFTDSVTNHKAFYQVKAVSD